MLTIKLCVTEIILMQTKMLMPGYHSVARTVGNFIRDVDSSERNVDLFFNLKRTITKKA